MSAGATRARVKRLVHEEVALVAEELVALGALEHQLVREGLGTGAAVLVRRRVI